jgi:DHA3 family macrolide efflux protein-like MFS transporter
MSASTTLMVPKKHLARVGGLNQAISGAVSIAAPALGAVLLLALPMWGILSVDVITAAVAIAPLLFIKIPQPVRSRDDQGKVPTVLGDMRDGFRFLRSWRGAFILILMIMVINLLFTPAVTLMPILVTSYFGKGLVEFATMEMAIGLSFVLGGVILGIWGGFKSKVVTMLVTGMLAGIGTAVVGFAPETAFYVAVGGMFFAGFMIAMVNGSASALMQATIPPDKQGRVFGLMGSLVVAMTPIGLAFAGPVADLVGVQVWFIVAGVGLFVIKASGFFMKSVMTIEDFATQQVAVEEK